MIPLAEMAEAVLRTPDGRAKTALSRDFAAQWQQANTELWAVVPAPWILVQDKGNAPVN